MQKSLDKILILFLSFILFSSISAQADKGVFNAQISPIDTITDTLTVVTITAEVGSEDLYISSVRAYLASNTGQPISLLGQMYDDGTHGDARPADTIFTIQVEVDEPVATDLNFVVTAAYQRDRNRYLSNILDFRIHTAIPYGATEEMVEITKQLKDDFLDNLSVVNVERALALALQQAINDPRVENAVLEGITLSLISKNGVRGIVILSDPSTPSDGPGNSVPTNLPQNFKSPGNDGVLIFAPGYNAADRQNQIADSALLKFNSAEYMAFSPVPLTITPDNNASLELVKDWGNYGAVVIHTHGGIFTHPVTNNREVVLLSGTVVSEANDNTYATDLAAHRLGVSDGKYIFYPSFIDVYANNMVNTFFYLGACHSLDNDTLWDALRAKGAKVALGWSDTVARSFNTEKFNELAASMLPTDANNDPLTVSQSFDNINDKVDGWCPFGICFGGDGAEFTLKTASADWDNFLFYESGLINGDFETGDWTGWIHGGQNGQTWQLVISSRVNDGSFAGALGRWDTAYHGSDPTAEPYGYEWFYQDFVVPQNVTYLKFYWWMETYDTAVWDWFDAYIQDTNGNTLVTILSQAGKPGTNYGPYWSTQIADGGSGWREVSVDISAYRGQEIRIYFDQRLDGYGDQQRVYVDDVTLE
jgi:hypothetical protein